MRYNPFLSTLSVGFVVFFIVIHVDHDVGAAATAFDYEEAESSKPVPPCHLKELEKDMFDYLFYFTHRPNTSGFPMDSMEWDLKCRGFKWMTDNMRGYLRRCASATVRDLANILLDTLNDGMAELCSRDSIAYDFYVKWTPCIHANVKTGDGLAAYKASCVNDIQAGLEWAESEYETLDERIPTLCCAYNRWEDCIGDAAIAAGCGAGSREAAPMLMRHATGGLIHLLCNRFDFDPKSETQCGGGVLPPRNTTALGRESGSTLSRLFTFICPNQGI